MNLGVICEFNPFHSGHKYLIDSAKSNINDNVICCMSGNFVQRGDFAIEDKYKRASIAIDNGADLVIELPTVCATLSAYGFAKCSTQLLEATGICDALAFGAECDDTNKLQEVADKIKSCHKEIFEELKSGISYPAARQKVVNSPLLETPNNILAIEYLTHTTLKPIAIKRIGKGHDSDDKIYSASEIRKNMNTDEIASYKNCEKAILYKLRTMTQDDFKNIEDVSEGLENRIVDAIRSSTSLTEIYDKIKTKRYTHSRIRRIILRAYLGISKDTQKEPQYIHVLAFNDKGKLLLKQMKEKATLPIITCYSNTDSLTQKGKDMFEFECKLTDIYYLAYKNPLPCGNEQRAKVVIKH